MEEIRFHWWKGGAREKQNGAGKRYKEAGRLLILSNAIILLYPTAVAVSS